MGTARRLYLYVVSAISLLALAAGMASLIATALGEVEDAVGGSLVVGGGTSREQLSLAIALIAVGGPVWAFHWWLVRRGMAVAGPRGDEERASGVRAWYMALVQGVTLGVGMASLVAVMGSLVTRLLGAPANDVIADPLAMAIVAVPVWALVARSRAAEIRATRMSGAAAWWTRLYRYGATFAALMVLLTGATGILSTLLSVIIGRPDFGLTDTFWRTLAAGQIAALTVGLGAWLIQWREAGTAVRDAARIGEDERRTRLRATYFGAVLLATVSSAAFVVASAAADLGRWLTGVSRGDTLAFLEQVVGPLITVLPIVAAAAWHVRFASREAATVDEAAIVSTRRNGFLLLSLVGLAFMAAGGVQLIQLGIEQATGRPPMAMLGDRTAAFQLPWYLAQCATGLLLWLPSWAGILGLRAADVGRERGAAATRAHLYLVVGAAVVAAVPAVTMVLYRSFDTLLGGGAGASILGELAFPIAVALVALLIGGYHGWLLLGDLRAPAEMAAGATGAAVAASPTTPAPAGTAPRTSGVAATGEVTLELTVHAQPGTDVAALLAELRDHIPPGASIEQHDGEEVRELAGVH